MASICELTGKGKQYGHNVSFSQRKTNRTWKPNIQTKTIVAIDANGVEHKIKMQICTQAIRILKKQGVLPKAGTKKA